MGVLSRANNTIEWHGKSASRFDPSTLDDAIAVDAQWTPLKPVNPNVVCLYRARLTSDTRLEFVPPAAKPYFCMTFIAFGILLVLGGALHARLSGDASALYVMAGAGLAFCAIGILGMMFKDAPLVFDMSTGCELAMGTCSAEQIYAVQIVPKKAYRDMVHSKDMFHNFEINLVLNDAERLHVLSHWDITTIREDARMLSDFLRIPLWDTSPDLDITERDLLSAIELMRSKYRAESANNRIHVTSL